MIGFLTHWLSRRDPSLSEAGQGDAAAIAALHARSFQRGWSEPEIEALLLDRQVVAHRAVAGRKLAGFILSRIAVDEAEILSIATDAKWQGRGLARSLLNLHLRRLAGLGVRAVFLEVSESNTPARRLYARGGFQAVGQRANYYAEGGHRSATALVLRRDL